MEKFSSSDKLIFVNINKSFEAGFSPLEDVIKRIESHKK